MKKTLSIFLALIMTFAMFALTACGGNEDSDVNNNKPVIESAVDFYTKVWAAFGEDNQFACGGGDEEHSNMEGPGQYALTDENADMLKYYLHLTDELYAMLDDDVATLQHMMNINTYSSAVAKLKDPSKASDFAEAYKTAIQNQQWMCGFPDKVVVISVGDYVVMAYGHEENINNLVTACSTVESSSSVLIDAPAMVE